MRKFIFIGLAAVVGFFGFNYMTNKSGGESLAEKGSNLNPGDYAGQAKPENVADRTAELIDRIFSISPEMPKYIAAFIMAVCLYFFWQKIPGWLKVVIPAGIVGVLVWALMK